MEILNILTKRLICLVLISTILFCSSEVHILAKRIQNTNSETTIQNADIFLADYQEIVNKSLHINSITSLVNDSIVYFDYNDDNNLIKETTKDSTISFAYDKNNRLISKSYNNYTINFYYKTELSQICSNIEINNVLYSLIYDDSNHVTGIENVDGELIAQYVYNDDRIMVLGYENNYGWIDMTEDKNFIGNLNPFRLNGKYYDDLSGYYIINSCIYDAKNEEYLMNSNVISDNGSNIASYALTSTSINLQAQQLLATSSYGKTISYSSTWYSSLSTQEILARLIYGECMQLVDEPALAWELINRKAANWSTFYGSGKENTLRNIALKSSQYSAITAGVSETEASRTPNVSSNRWIKATWYACAICEAQTRSNLETLVSKPTGINKQCYHVGLILRNSFTGTTSSSLKYNGSSIKNVVIVNVNSNIKSATTIKNYYSNYSTYNIFFTYSNEYGTNYSFT